MLAFSRLLHLQLLPLLPLTPLVRHPTHHAQSHACAQQHKHHQGSVERKLALVAQRCEVAVAHVACQCHVLLHRCAVPVLARPCLDSVELGPGVEDVHVDDGDNRKQGRRTCGAKGQECTQSVLVWEVNLLFLLVLTLRDSTRGCVPEE